MMNKQARIQNRLTNPCYERLKSQRDDQSASTIKFEQIIAVRNVFESGIELTANFHNVRSHENRVRHPFKIAVNAYTTERERERATEVGSVSSLKFSETPDASQHAFWHEADYLYRNEFYRKFTIEAFNGLTLVRYRLQS